MNTTFPADHHAEEHTEHSKEHSEEHSEEHSTAPVNNGGISVIRASCLTRRSGSGRSTLIDLVLGFTAPTAGTVRGPRNHLSSVIGKTGAANRHEAVSAARENGWL